MCLDGEDALNLRVAATVHILRDCEQICWAESQGGFDRAVQVAHFKLELAVEMKNVCDIFENHDFRKLALVFHKSGDELGHVLKTEDTNKSLEPLHDTIDALSEKAGQQGISLYVFNS